MKISAVVACRVSLFLAFHYHRAPMSEYQYYEFQTADRSLSEMEMHEPAWLLDSGSHYPQPVS